MIIVIKASPDHLQRIGNDARHTHSLSPVALNREGSALMVGTRADLKDWAKAELLEPGDVARAEASLAKLPAEAVPDGLDSAFRYVALELENVVSRDTLPAAIVRQRTRLGRSG